MFNVHGRCCESEFDDWSLVHWRVNENEWPSYKGCQSEKCFFKFYFHRSGYFLRVSLRPLVLTVSGLAKVAIFTTNVDADNQTLINHKCVCGALNRHFCQTRVTSSASSSDVAVSVHFTAVLVRWFGGSFAFFVWLCAVAKKQMYHQMRWYQRNLTCKFNLI